MLVNDLSDVIMLRAGYAHTCALTRDGKVKCWGLNLSSNDTYSDSPIEEAVDAIALSAGDQKTCIIKKDGEAACSWRFSGYGEYNTIDSLKDAIMLDPNFNDYICAFMKDGTVKCPNIMSNGPEAYDLSNMVAMSKYCALKNDGTIICWHDSNAPDGLSDVVALSCGSKHTCVIKSDGAVQCWGDNFFGQLGDGSQVDSLIPVTVIDLNIW
jgi:alpha-tubulin suppressor-like RCC1 family protein